MALMLQYILTYIFMKLFIENPYVYFKVLYPIMIFLYYILDFAWKRHLDNYCAVSTTVEIIDSNNKKVYIKTKNNIFVDIQSRGYYINSNWVDDTKMPFFTKGFHKE